MATSEEVKSARDTYIALVVSTWAQEMDDRLRDLVADDVRRYIRDAVSWDSTLDELEGHRVKFLSIVGARWDAFTAERK